MADILLVDSGRCRVRPISSSTIRHEVGKRRRRRPFRFCFVFLGFLFCFFLRFASLERFFLFVFRCCLRSFSTSGSNRYTTGLYRFWSRLKPVSIADFQGCTWVVCTEIVLVLIEIDPVFFYRIALEVVWVSPRLIEHCQVLRRSDECITGFFDRISLKFNNEQKKKSNEMTMKKRKKETKK